MSPADRPPLPPPILAALTKFYELNDDLADIQKINRRIFFQFLRSNPTLTPDELDTLESLSELLDEICLNRQQAA